MPTDATPSADLQEVLQRGLKHVWRHGQPPITTIEKHGPMAVSGSGMYIEDAMGKRYLDGLSGGSAAATLGHGRADIAQAAYDQMTTLQWSSLRTFLNRPAIELGTQISEITGGDFETSFYACSGSEAVEVAVQIVKSYHRNKGNTSKQKFLYRTSGYHGTTHIGASANSFRSSYADWFQPVMPGFVETAACYAYRAEDPDTCESAAAALEETILSEGPETIAGILAESIPSAWVLPPTPHYMRRLREICTKYDILWIDDEVFIGFGRTGKYFGYQHFDVVPDIITVSKGITAGYIPLSAAVASPAVMKVIRGDDRTTWANVAGHTYSGHASACAAGLEVLDIIKREDLLANVTRLGEHMLNRFWEYAKDQPLVGDVRGKGFLVGIEMVANRETKERLPPELGFSNKFVARAMENNFMCRGSGDLVQLFPALVAEDEHIDAIVDATIDAIEGTIDELGL